MWHRVRRIWEPQRVSATIPEKVLTRVRRMPTADLAEWADQAIYTTGRTLGSYRRDRAPDYLLEAQTGAQVLLAIVDEMRRRDEPRRV